LRKSRRDAGGPSESSPAMVGMRQFKDAFMVTVNLAHAKPRLTELNVKASAAPIHSDV
jgi:hypothetical protein